MQRVAHRHHDITEVTITTTKFHTVYHIN